MEATVLRSVVLLGILVLSIAAPAPVPAPQESSIVVPNTSTITCAEKCVISCALNIFSPGKYAACIGLCITACKIQPTSNVAAYACTRSCVTSISKSITTTTKPSFFETTRYAEGYVDSCYQSCSKKI